MIGKLLVDIVWKDRHGMLGCSGGSGMTFYYITMFLDVTQWLTNHWLMILFGL